MSFFQKLFGRKPAVVLYGEPGLGSIRTIALENPAHVGIAPSVMPTQETHSIQRRVAWMRKYEMRYQMFDAPLVPTEEPATTFRYDVFAGAGEHLGRITVMLEGFALDLHAERKFIRYDFFPTLEEAADELIRVCGGTVVP